MASLLVGVALDRAAVDLDDLVVDGHLSRAVRRRTLVHALHEDPRQLLTLARVPGDGDAKALVVLQFESVT